MDTNRIESFKQFSKYLEYPMVVFEAETGNVLDINYEAEVLLGGPVTQIHLEPGRAVTMIDFWEKLHDKKTVMWQRMRLLADEREYSINGLVNEGTFEGKIIYSLMFELQTDTSFGGLVLERILCQANTVVVRLGRDEDNFRVEFISKNINEYGYTREQFYEGIIYFDDLVCPEDWEWVEDTVEDAAKAHEKELVFSCRIFTEIRELIPVRVNIHFIYNDFGKLTDLELLITDTREELKRNSENMYLNRAISKMKSVVLVKSYHAGKRTLKYISPNAGMVGMNVEALNRGYKLTEDYIHPADRDDVIDTIYQAVANGVTDYTQTYRMVRDDGEQIWVLNEVTVTRMSDGEAEISFLLTDITEKKEIENELAVAKEGLFSDKEGTETDDLALVTIDEEDEEMLAQLQLMAATLSQNADYYIVVLDSEGKLLTDPMGPVEEIGQFYDLFERPQFKEQFHAVSDKVKEQVIPQSVSFSMDKLKVHMVLAPLVLKDVVTAYWVLTSFSPDGMEILESVMEQQWLFANAIAKSSYAQELAQQEQKLRKLTEIQLDKEQKGKQVLRDILNCIVKKSEAGLGEACQKAGSYLSVMNIALYKTNKEGQKAESYYLWNRSGEDSSFFDMMALSASENKVLLDSMGTKGYVIMDKSSTEPFLHEMLRQTGMGIILVRRMIMGSGERGYIVFADAGRQRKFDEKDITFIEVVAQIFEGMLVSNQKMIRAQDLKENFLEAYDHIRDAVFVKDNETGDIIFTNKAMDKLFGYSLVGTPANQVVNDQLEQYREIGGVRKRFIANKKVTKWQRYMKELDQIMNIVEIHMELFQDTDCSLFILKKNKQKLKS